MTSLGSIHLVASLLPALLLPPPRTALDDSTAHRKLSGPFTAPPPVTGSVQGVALTPDGTRAVYRGDQEVDEVVELYTVPLDGSTPALKISAPVTEVLDFLVAPDDVHVVFRGRDAVGPGLFVVAL